MKRILLSAGIIISLNASAQENNLVENYFNRQLKSRLPVAEVPHLNAIDCTTGNLITTDLHSLQPSTTLNGGKVVTLPQDGMACIQPDLSLFNMPNAGAGIQIEKSGPGVIPNPGNKPVTVLPRGKTTLMKKP